MNADRHTVVTRQSWGSRLGDSLKGVVVGLILFVLAFPLLIWNEGRAVRRQRALEEGAAAVVSVSSDQINLANDGRLVHLFGRAETTQTLSDAEFGVAADVLRLERRVQMYQWRERKESDEQKKVGGGTETVTTYTYSRGWEGRLIESSRFEQIAGHENPAAMSYQGRDFVADEVTLGAFRLSPELVGRIDSFEPLVLGATAGEGAGVPSLKRSGDGFYVGVDPATPQVGDLRISFAVVRPAEISIVARQSGASFGSFTTTNGGEILLLEQGRRTAEQMFQSALTGNRVLSWILRGVGLLVMALGLSMVMGPVVVLADVIPVLGSIAAAGTGVIALLIAAVLSLITIAIAWLAYRPLLGGSLLLVALVLFILLVRRLRNPQGEPST